MLCSGPEELEHADLNVSVMSCHKDSTVLHYVD